MNVLVSNAPAGRAALVRSSLGPSIGKRRSQFRDWVAEETDHLREVRGGGTGAVQIKIGPAHSHTDLYGVASADR